VTDFPCLHDQVGRICLCSQPLRHWPVFQPIIFQRTCNMRPSGQSMPKCRLKFRVQSGMTRTLWKFCLWSYRESNESIANMHNPVRRLDKSMGVSDRNCVQKQVAILILSSYFNSFTPCSIPSRRSIFFVRLTCAISAPSATKRTDLGQCSCRRTSHDLSFFPILLRSSGES